MNTRAGIYLVRTQEGRTFTVVAFTTTDAVELAAFRINKEAAVPAGTTDSSTFEAGRIGDYDPSMTGARLMQAAGPVIG